MLLVYLLYNFPHGGNMYKHFEEIFVTPSWQKKNEFLCFALDFS